MDAGRELLEVTLSASHPVILPPEKPYTFSCTKHHPSLDSHLQDSATPASDLLSSLNSTSESETSCHAPNNLQTADALVDTFNSMNRAGDAVNGARRHFEHSGNMRHMMQSDKMDTSMDMSSSEGSIRIRVPSRMLKEIAPPLAHERINTPTPPPALRGHYNSQAGENCPAVTPLSSTGHTIVPSVVLFSDLPSLHIES